MPDGYSGAQLYLSPATAPDGYTRDGVGLQHLAFLVPTRDAMRLVGARRCQMCAERPHRPRFSAAVDPPVAPAPSPLG